MSTEDSTKSPPTIAGAICAPPAAPQEPLKDQPRQPTSLQGLLKFAMEATKAEDAPHDSKVLPLDEEKKQFLTEALGSITVNVVEVLQKNKKILESVDTAPGNEDEYINALETITDYVDNIDTANDFHKIGGFVVLPQCLKSPSPRVRAGACNLIAELCQNNPHCQRVVLENGFMSLLLDIVDNDTEVDVIVKALYAISCIVRSNHKGTGQFLQYKGLQIFLETLGKYKTSDKCVTKICFLLNSFCETKFVQDLNSRLVFMGYVPVLIALLEDVKPSNEHVYGLLYNILENNMTARYEALKAEHGLKEILEETVDQLQGKDEHQEDLMWCKKLQALLFTS